jgi:hypothetical protein
MQADALNLYRLHGTEATSGTSRGTESVALIAIIIVDAVSS